MTSGLLAESRTQRGDDSVVTLRSPSPEKLNLLFEFNVRERYQEFVGVAGTSGEVVGFHTPIIRQPQPDSN